MNFFRALCEAAALKLRTEPTLVNVLTEVVFVEVLLDPDCFGGWVEDLLKAWTDDDGFIEMRTNGTEYRGERRRDSTSTFLASSVSLVLLCELTCFELLACAV